MIRKRFVPFLMVVPLWSASALGQVAPQHVAKVRTVTAIATNPDSNSVAYLLSVPRRPLLDEDGPAWSEVHLVDREGRTFPLLTGEVNASDLAWVPGGGLSYLAKRGKDKTKSLYVFPSGMGESAKKLARPSDLASYSWAPDGQSLAFLAPVAVPEAVEELKKKGMTQEVYEESLPFVKVGVATFGAGEPVVRELELKGSASELRFSPKGDRLAVALAPTPTVDDNFMFRRVHVVDVATGKPVVEVKTEGKLGAIGWSPNGEKLALIGARDVHDPHEGRLVVADLAMGGKTQDLFPKDDKGHVVAFDWTNEETIAFVRAEGTGSVFGTVTLKGGPKSVALPFVATALDVAEELTAFVADAPDFPAEVAIGGTEPKRLTHSNPILKDVKLAKQEVLKFKARDGLELEGVLVRPLEEAKGKPFPLVLVVHGGPEAHVSNGWTTSYANPGQVAAARGIGAFYPNYRGSTGRGVDFSKLGQGDAAGKEFDDLVDAVDHLVKAGLVDPKKVGVTGGSYGGYATAWCSTKHSEKFAVGVMFVGISDKVSKAGTSDIPNEEFYVHALKRPWDAWPFFLERSPIYHADKSKTPLLIMHGKEDPRVFPGQSLELYRSLKLRGKAPVRLVWYPGEGHGNKRAASRYDYQLRSIQWLEHYLVGPGGGPPPYLMSYPPVE